MWTVNIREVLKKVRRLYSFIERVFADGGYPRTATAAAVRELGAWNLEIVKRSDTTKGFKVLPKRWIVERTFRWLGRCRRLAKSFLGFLHLTAAKLWLSAFVNRT